MIQQINRYGPLDRPEQQKHIELTENPLGIVIGTYNLWLQIAQRIDQVKGRGYSPVSLYQEAVNLLQPYAKKFANVKPDGLDSILSQIKDEDTEASGLYLSALLNATDLPELEGIFNHKTLGYKLAPGKTLIVREGSQIDVLGFLGQGTLINFGEASLMAGMADGGIQANYGLVRLMFASMTQSGVYINFGNFDDSSRKRKPSYAGGMGDTASGVQLNYGYGKRFAVSAFKGVQINFGDVESMSHGAYGALQINYGNVRGMMNNNVIGGTQINMGATKRFRKSKHGVQYNLGTVHQGKIQKIRFMLRDHKLFETLEEKLDEINYLKELNGSSEAIIFIKEYDWKKYEKEVLDLGGQIQKALAK